ncbi:MAG: hypothetical protein DMD74_09800 [Gemmatimonadetes bacterium]|nr:MAG: hypothetical protein DMD74_09800 [Gemmatimonadota bacterium]
MFHVLPGSDTPLRSPVSGLVAALVSHAAIVAVVLASHSARGPQSPPIIIVGPEAWSSPSPIRTPPLPRPPVVAGTVSLPHLPVSDLPTMPPLDAGGVPVGVPPQVPSLGGIPGVGEVWESGVVDERPEVLSGPVLAYPEPMRQGGIEGRVVVEVVIDTLGRAEPASLRIVESPQRAFETSALSYVRRALFRPARVLGRPVRVLIRLPIEFRIMR